MTVSSLTEEVIVSWLPVNGEPLDCRVHGDFDGDGSVGLGDDEFFEVCLWFSGPEGAPGFQECVEVFDFDGDDDDVDLMEFAEFQTQFDAP